MNKYLSFIISTLLFLTLLPLTASSHEGCSDHHGTYLWPSEAVSTWTCPTCGRTGNTGKFCPQCGTKRPDPWTCPTCGKDDNYGKFCPKCGTARPEATPEPSQSPAVTSASMTPLYLQKVSGELMTFHLDESSELSFAGGDLIIESGTDDASFSVTDVQRLAFNSAAASSPVSGEDYSSEDTKAVFIYRNDGGFNAFMQRNVEKITHSQGNLDIFTADSTYTIPCASIDSIGLHRFKTEYTSKVVKLEPYVPYVTYADSINITFDKSLPAEMAVHKGDILLYEGICDKFPDGFAARVGSIDSGDGYACKGEPVGIDDVYDKILVIGEYSLPGQSVTRAAGSAATRDISTGIDVSSRSISISYNAMSATISPSISPDFTATVVKTDALIPAKVDFTVSLDYSLTVTASGSVTKSSPRYTGPLIHLIPPVPMPQCPMFHVSLTANPFLIFTGKGELSATAQYSGRFKVNAGYNENGMYINPSYNSSATKRSLTAKLEGSVFTGIDFIPNISFTGGLAELGPVVSVGPEVVADLDLDALAGSGAYTQFYDNSVKIYAKGELSAGIVAQLFGVKKTQYLPSISYGYMVKELYYVPAFSQPKTVERQFRDVIAITDVTRELLFPLTVGMKIEDIGNYVAPGPYDTPTLTMENKFSGFRYCTPYKVTPVIEDFFGLQLDAIPERDIYLEPEVVTGGATEVTEHSAVLHGSIPDATYNGFQGAGIRVLGRGDHACAIGENGSLTVSVGGLAEETAYQYQAYVLCEGHVFYGAVETFITKGRHGDGNVETPVKPHNNNQGDDDFKYIYIEPRDHFKYVQKYADGSTVLAGVIGNRFIEKNYRHEEYHVCNLALKTVIWNTPDEEYSWQTDDEYNYIAHEDWVERGGYLPFPVELSAFHDSHFMKIFYDLFDGDTSRLKQYLIKEEVICGVKCWVFDTKDFNAIEERFWVDPKTGWCLKYEDYRGDGRNNWEFIDYDPDYREWTDDIVPRRM